MVALSQEQPTLVALAVIEVTRAVQRFDLVVGCLECGRTGCRGPPARVLVGPLGAGQRVAQANSPSGAPVDSAGGQVLAEGADRVDPGLFVGRVEGVCLGAAAEQAGRVQDAQPDASIARAERVSREPFGSLSLN